MTEKELKEIKYYLGYGANEADERTKSVIESVFSEYESAVCEKYLTKTFECTVSDKSVVLLCDGKAVSEFYSKKLAKHLSLCDKVTLMAATVGAACDRLMLRYEHTEIAKAAVCQACGAYFIERLCDSICDRLKKETSRELTFRFSPGYGDLKLETQRELFNILECRRIGLTLTDSCLTVPTKSVTAFIGHKKPGMKHNIEK